MKKREFIIRNEDFRRRLIALISKLDLNKPKQIVISDWVKRNSPSQKALYFMWMTEIADDTGHTKNEMHEFFKRQFLAPQTIEVGGCVSDIPPSIAKLSTVEMSEYMERIQAFAGTELGFMLTMPEGRWAA